MQFDYIYNLISEQFNEDPSEYKSDLYSSKYSSESVTNEDFEFNYKGKTYLAIISYDIEKTNDDFSADKIEQFKVSELYRFNEDKQEYEPISIKNPDTEDIIKNAFEEKYHEPRG